MYLIDDLRDLIKFTLQKRIKENRGMNIYVLFSSILSLLLFSPIWCWWFPSGCQSCLRLTVTPGRQELRVCEYSWHTLINSPKSPCYRGDRRKRRSKRRRRRRVCWSYVFTVLPNVHCWRRCCHIYLQPLAQCCQNCIITGWDTFASLP